MNCTHEETTQEPGVGRWIGEHYVEPTLEVCEECGEVLAVI